MVVAIPFDESMTCRMRAPITLHRGLGEVFDRCRGHPSRRDEAREPIGDVEQDLFLLAKWNVAQLDDEGVRRMVLPLSCNGQIT